MRFKKGDLVKIITPTYENYTVDDNNSKLKEPVKLKFGDILEIQDNWRPDPTYAVPDGYFAWVPSKNVFIIIYERSIEKA